MHPTSPSRSRATTRRIVVWNAATLDRWPADPEKSIPGQKMGYSVPAAMDRADLIAWLGKKSGR